MARKLSLNDSGKFVGGSNEYFSLADDGDCATVRLLYDDPNGEDLDLYLVHQVEIGGKKRYVACNALDDEGNLCPNNCPLCKAGNYRGERLLLQLYNIDEDKVQIWDRGKSFVTKIASLIRRYSPLCAQPFDVERSGKKGDKNTTYDLFNHDVDGMKLEDLPEKQELLGSLIIEATAEEMYDMLDGKYKLPDSGNSSSSGNERRRERSSERSSNRGNRGNRGGRSSRNSEEDNF